MSKTQVSGDIAAEVPPTGAVETKLEFVVIPVADVDRAKRFYLSGNLIETNETLRYLSRGCASTRSATATGSSAGRRSKSCASTCVPCCGVAAPIATSAARSSEPPGGQW
jgi:hypothetical protein